MRRVIGGVVLAVLLGAFTESAAQLPPEIMADRYLVQAERLMKEKEFKAALEAMEKIVALQKEHDLTLPAEFHFKYAQIAQSAGLLEAAIAAVNRYLVAAGRAGKFYREALELLDQAEKLLVQAEQEERRRQIRPILPEMVAIPGGSFRMGCVSGKGCRDDENPVHEVTIAEFALSKYEVTFEEYDRFTDATGRQPATNAIGGQSAGDYGWGRGRRPVINVSWKDAVAYTEWLSEKTGERYRLPSEAEWEYAARAGSETKYHFGDEVSQLCRYGNHAETSTDYSWRNTACSDGVGKRTATVGRYQPNGWGLYDMHGNVWEWVGDCWNTRYKGAPTDGSAWETGNCGRRVWRGGSWHGPPGSLRAAARFKAFPGLWAYYLGFRVARTLTP